MQQKYRGVSLNILIFRLLPINLFYFFFYFPIAAFLIGLIELREADQLVTPLAAKAPLDLESRQSARTLNRRTHEEAQGNREKCG